MNETGSLCCRDILFFLFFASLCGHNASFLLSTIIKIQTYQSFIYSEQPVSYLLFMCNYFIFFVLFLVKLCNVPVLFCFFFVFLQLKRLSKVDMQDLTVLVFFLFVWHWSRKHEIPRTPCLPDRLLLKCLIQLISREYTVIARMKHQAFSLCRQFPPHCGRLFAVCGFQIYICTCVDDTCSLRRAVLTSDKSAAR